MTRAAALLSRALVVASLAAGMPAALAAQQDRTIDAGMTHAQVVERLGKPKGERTAGEYTYLFYGNNCLKRCGIDDVVTLQNDAVVDAIFRSPNRHYTGESSSPRALDAAAARGTRSAITTSDGSAAPASPGRGGFVVGSPAGAADSSAKPRSRRGRGTATTRRGRTRAAARPVVPMPRLSGTDSTAAASTAGDVDSLRTGRRTTTGPVDAGAAVKNAGGRLFPSSTPVRSSGGPGADSAVGSSAGRVPFQGSKLAPADSAAVVNRRPAPSTPPKSDSTRPPARPPASDR
ncbi:MAG TPA: hypothetical protein VFJ74_00460 [Gemmatimonadaceae bacterium]|nr:hypothetical protein [Gemmatimonadaceae bacterium]